MISHYNAFISYKHADVDSRVAEMVQKDLENFHIPHKLAKKLGINRIDRIFRDKTELPATNDLSEEITYALNNSDFLIVICSPRVKESVWVQREIELFLRTHSKKSVLTVIAEGDPTEVIPPILLYDEITVMQPNGVYSTVRITIEPLSCDYRDKRRIVKRDELPRLASCIIGCSYDELMRRRRKHEIHRVIGIASIAAAVFLAFGLYMFYSRTIINRNYTNALINRSRYLATESGKYLEDEDRIMALFLSLAALPSEEKPDIPVTPEAERALTDASLAYVTLDGQHLNALRNYRLPGTIRDFKVSPKGRYLIAYDEHSNIGMWDTLSGSEIFSNVNDSSSIVLTEFIDESSAIVVSYNTASCYETETGNLLWQNDDSAITYSTKVEPLGSYIYFLDDFNVIVVDKSDGSIKETIKLPEKYDDKDLSYIDFKVSPSGQYIALECYYGFLDTRMFIYDTKSKELTNLKMEENEKFIQNFEWTEFNTLCTSFGIDADNQRSLSVSILSEDHSTIRCYDPAGKKVLWENEFVFTGVSVEDGFLELPETDSILYFSSSKAEIYDRKTGELKYSHNTGSNILSASDSNNDGIPLYVTEDGEIIYLDKTSSDGLYVVNEMTDNIDIGYFNDNAFVHKRFSNDIICYAYSLYDSDWAEMSNSPILSDISNYYLDENVLAILSDNDSSTLLSVYDTNSAEFLMQETLSNDPEINSYYYNLLGSDGRRLYYIHNDGDEKCLFSLDLQSKAITKVTVLSEDLYTNNYTYSNGKVYYPASTDEGYEFRIYDIESDTTESVPIDIDYLYAAGPPFLSEDNNYAYLSSFEEKNEVLIDIRNKTFTEVVKPEMYKTTTNVAFDPVNNLVVISDKSNVITLDMNGIEKCRLTNMEISTTGLYMWVDDKTSTLLIPYNNGTMSFYDPNTLEETSSMEISFYINDNNAIDNYQLDKENSILYMSSNYLTNVIDLRNKYETACIESCFGHHMGTDRFYNKFSKINGQKHIGYFRHYKIDELIEKGKIMLGDSEMSESDKLKYGIDDE